MNITDLIPELKETITQFSKACREYSKVFVFVISNKEIKLPSHSYASLDEDNEKVFSHTIKLIKKEHAETLKDPHLILKVTPHGLDYFSSITMFELAHQHLLPLKENEKLLQNH
jgi:hypothetical protein